MGVLDDMTKGITERKAAAAGPKLTPVGLENSSTKPSMPVDVPGVLFAAEDLQAKSASLRAYAAQLIAVADGLDAMAGTPGPTTAEAVKQVGIEKKLAEKEADRQDVDRKAAAAGDQKAAARVEVAESPEFVERLEKLQTEAQAAVFTNADAVASEPVASGGWECSDHGSKSIETLTSRKGRVYLACSVDGCGQFQK